MAGSVSIGLVCPESSREWRGVPRVDRKRTAAGSIRCPSCGATVQLVATDDGWTLDRVRNTHRAAGHRLAIRTPYVRAVPRA